MTKVLFNIKKLQLSPITAINADGLPTYGSPLKVPGTVSLKLDQEGESEPFHADGIAYFTAPASTTYTGSLENAHFTAEVLKSIFAYMEDTNKNLVETNEATKEFGAQFACDSDEGEVYFTLYRVSSTKPNINLQTNESKANINPESVNITVSPITLINGTNVIKSFAEKSATNYENYFTAITLPSFTPNQGA